MESKALVPSVVKETLPTPQEAYEVYTEIVERKSMIAHNFIELGRLFKRVRDQKLYELLDHESMNAFIASPEIAFSRSTVYSLIDIYELFIIECKYNQNEIVKIPWSKLNMIKGEFKKSKDPDLLFKAETLSQKDLLDEIHLLEGRAPKEYKPPKEKKTEPVLTNCSSYDAFIKEFGCILGCKEDAEPHHFPKTKGAGAPDHWKIPLCRKCHTEWQEKKMEFIRIYGDKIFGYFYNIILSIFEYLTAEEKNDNQTTEKTA